jgi:RNAse (barnase) inhibitor barstar
MSTSTTKKVYAVDGSRFYTLAEYAAEFTRVIGLTMPWGGNLDAFNDFLHGGFGTPDEGFILVWRNSDVSRQRLGYGETLRWLEEIVHSCHPSNIGRVQEQIAAARRQEGDTLFDMLVEIVHDHEDIELRLE